MKRAAVALAVTVAGLIPLWRYHPAASAGVHLDTSSPRTSASGASTPQNTTTPNSSSGTRSTTTTRTVKGSVVQTPYGPYQVSAVFKANQIVDVQLITEPSDGHSQRIASGAAPILRQEALQAQSAKIDAVSGATIVSEAYAQSLQAAIDKIKG